MPVYRRSVSAALIAITFVSGPAAAVDGALIDAAKREGVVTVYTILVAETIGRPLAAAFEAKYGIKADLIRSDPAEQIRRIDAEAKAGRTQADVFDGANSVAYLKREGLVLRWIPDSASDLPQNFVDADGYWAGLYTSVTVPAVNTDLVRAGEEPKNWKDLLDPKFKGKMVWSLTGGITGAAGVAAMAVREFGEQGANDYLSKLAEQNVASVPTTPPQVLDQVIAGEYSLTIINAIHNTVFNTARGAPIKFLPFNPAPQSLVTVSVLRDAPHPNAAKLYADFVVSEEGQKIFSDNFYLPANSRVPPKDPKAIAAETQLRGEMFTPEQIDADLSKWMGMISKYFR